MLVLKTQRAVESSWAVISGFSTKLDTRSGHEIGGNLRSMLLECVDADGAQSDLVVYFGDAGHDPVWVQRVSTDLLEPAAK